MLLLFILLVLLVIYENIQYGNTCKVIRNPIVGVAPESIKIAHRYHGINYSYQKYPNRKFYFTRNGKEYELFDFKQFPKLKKLIKEKQNDKRN